MRFYPGLDRRSGFASNRSYSPRCWLSSLRIKYRCTRPFWRSGRRLWHWWRLACRSRCRIATFHLSSELIQWEIPIHNMSIRWLPRWASCLFRLSQVDGVSDKHGMVLEDRCLVRFQFYTMHSAFDVTEVTVPHVSKPIENFLDFVVYIKCIGSKSSCWLANSFYFRIRWCFWSCYDLGLRWTIKRQSYRYRALLVSRRWVRIRSWY